MFFRASAPAGRALLAVAVGSIGRGVADHSTCCCMTNQRTGATLSGTEVSPSQRTLRDPYGLLMEGPRPLV